MGEPKQQPQEKAPPPRPRPPQPSRPDPSISEKRGAREPIGHK